MIQKGDKVWMTRNDTSVRLFKNEEDARSHYLELLKYYKNHTKKTHNDYWIYDVWHVVDENDMHYACIKATVENGIFQERDISISYSEYSIY